jgi:hypothetical protein
MSAGFFRAGCAVVHRFVGFAYRETANVGIMDILTGEENSAVSAGRLARVSHLCCGV